eukprot:Skav200775  [mRNA]  locus=scaffold2001:478386:488356:+ [translate_table: standard]
MKVQRRGAFGKKKIYVLDTDVVSSAWEAGWCSDLGGAWPPVEAWLQALQEESVCHPGMQTSGYLLTVDEAQGAAWLGSLPRSSNSNVSFLDDMLIPAPPPRQRRRRSSKAGHSDDSDLSGPLGGPLLRQGWALLHHAARHDQVHNVKLLLEAGAEKDSRSNEGRTVTWVAAAHGHLEVVRLLVEAGADCNQATTDDGTTALWMAARNGHLEVARLLVKAGADCNQARTCDGATPLLMAAHKGHSTVVRLLVEVGADLTRGTSDDGTTPLHAAVQNGRLDVISLLVDAGAVCNPLAAAPETLDELRDLVTGAQLAMIPLKPPPQPELMTLGSDDPLEHEPDVTSPREVRRREPQGEVLSQWLRVFL